MPIKFPKALIFIWLLILAGNSFLQLSPQKHSPDETPAISAVNVKLITDAFTENINPDTDHTKDGKIDSNSNNFAIYLCYSQHTSNLGGYPNLKNNCRLNIQKSRAPPSIYPA